MIRIVTNQVMTAEDGSKVYLAEIYGTSEDDKPTAGFVTGSAFTEVNTGKRFLYDEESGDWTEVSGTGGGGGGGSSDFSTATVTIDIGAGVNAPIAITAILENTTLAAMAGLTEEGINTLTVPLYKGLCIWVVTGSTASLAITVSGDIVFSIDDGNFTITGDGSITLRTK